MKRRLCLQTSGARQGRKYASHCCCCHAMPSLATQELPLYVGTHQIRPQALLGPTLRLKPQRFVLFLFKDIDVNVK